MDNLGVPLFNGKRIADCEILSYNAERCVGLANFRGLMVRFEGHRVETDSKAKEYARLKVNFLDSHTLELKDLQA